MTLQIQPDNPIYYLVMKNGVPVEAHKFLSQAIDAQKAWSTAKSDAYIIPVAPVDDGIPTEITQGEKTNPKGFQLDFDFDLSDTPEVVIEASGVLDTEPVITKTEEDVEYPLSLEPF